MGPLVERELVVEGVRLRYLEREAAVDSAKPTLLFLHGLIGSGETFLSVIAELPEGHRVIALDLPGEEVPEGVPVYLAALAERVLLFAASVGLEKPVVVGHSYGGVVALQMAAMSPEKLAGLILISPAHPFLLRERFLIGFYNSRIGGMVARSFRRFPRWVEGWGLRRVIGPKGRAAEIDFKYYERSLNDPVKLGHALRLIKTWNDDMDALGRRLEAEPIRLPTSFLWGDSDPVVPVSTAPRLERHFTAWEHFTLEGVGHLPNDEAPAECGRVIRTWLVGLETGRVDSTRDGALFSPEL